MLINVLSSQLLFSRFKWTLIDNLTSHSECVSLHSYLGRSLHYQTISFAFPGLLRENLWWPGLCLPAWLVCARFSQFRKWSLIIKLLHRMSRYILLGSKWIWLLHQRGTTWSTLWSRNFSTLLSRTYMSSFFHFFESIAQVTPSLQLDLVFLYILLTLRRN